MNPTSKQKVLKSPVKIYATIVVGRRPQTKYQTKAHAKLALHDKMGQHRDYPNYLLQSIEVYKLNAEYNIFELIFDGESELAKAFRNKELTAAAMIDSIDW